MTEKVLCELGSLCPICNKEEKVLGFCKICGKQFTADKFHPYKQFCSKKCLQKKYDLQNKMKGVITCNSCGKNITVLFNGKQVCSEECLAKTKLKTALYRANHPDKVEQDRITLNNKRKLPSEKERIAVWQKDYHLKNRQKRIAMQKVRYETKKKAVLDECKLCGATKNLQVHHCSYENLKDFFVVCEPCHRKIHRKYDYSSIETIKGGLIALSKM